MPQHDVEQFWSIGPGREQAAEGAATIPESMQGETPDDANTDGTGAPEETVTTDISPDEDAAAVATGNKGPEEVAAADATEAEARPRWCHVKNSVAQSSALSLPTSLVLEPEARGRCAVVSSRSHSSSQLSKETVGNVTVPANKPPIYESTPQPGR